ncbi:MAG TPA: site-2 protease family protein [Bryobacteraceae bacterium]|nr:site-2 protease family protein [Bryobacteraceae bacterium]
MFPEDLIESATRTAIAPQVRFERPASRIYAPPKNRLWLHALLLVVTLFTTTLVGAHMQYNFNRNLPFFDLERDLDIFTIGLRSWHLFLSGLPFSLTLLTILMAHELGHYLACLYYGVDATLPYFLPAPTPFTGTLGAFIRIRSMVQNKRVLFDIGIAGPLAGFLFVIPALGVGLAFSKIIPGINHQGAIQLGTPALQWMLQRVIFPGVAAGDIYLHPVARAAWVGMFATALNLLPVGQLDGGHIVYALLGRSHKWITQTFLVALLPMGKLWSGWWFWAAILFLFARKHPALYDYSEIGNLRVRLGLLALVVFLLCFSVAPIIG